MAGSLNEVNLIGHLGKDPEVRTTNNGERVANFSIATSESWTDKSSGEKKEKTEWHTVVAWGKLAEIAEKYLEKGMKVFVRGKMQTRKWQDKDNKDRWSTEVVLSGFDAKLLMLGGGGQQDRNGDERDASGSAVNRDGSGGGNQSRHTRDNGGSGGDYGSRRESFSDEIDDDSIPF